MTDITLKDNYLRGDLIKVLNITKNWTNVPVELDSFYQKFDEYQEALDMVQGPYTDLVTDNQAGRASVRFAYEEDAVIFKASYDRCL